MISKKNAVFGPYSAGLHVRRRRRGVGVVAAAALAAFFSTMATAMIEALVEQQQRESPKRAWLMTSGRRQHRGDDEGDDNENSGAFSRSCFEVMMPIRPSSVRITGSWNATPKAKINDIISDRYSPTLGNSWICAVSAPPVLLHAERETAPASAAPRNKPASSQARKKNGVANQIGQETRPRSCL